MTNKQFSYLAAFFLMFCVSHISLGQEPDEWFWQELEDYYVVEELFSNYAADDNLQSQDTFQENEPLDGTYHSEENPEYLDETPTEDPYYEYGPSPYSQMEDGYSIQLGEEPGEENSEPPPSLNPAYEELQEVADDSKSPSDEEYETYQKAQYYSMALGLSASISRSNILKTKQAREAAYEERQTALIMNIDCSIADGFFPLGNSAYQDALWSQLSGDVDRAKGDTYKEAGDALWADKKYAKAVAQYEAAFPHYLNTASHYSDATEEAINAANWFYCACFLLDDLIRHFT